MSFGHLQRDTGMQNSVSNVSSLNQALGPHLTPTLSSRVPFPDGQYRLSDSPSSGPILDASNVAQRSAAAQNVTGPSHSPIHEFSLPLNNDSPIPGPVGPLKRKQTGESSVGANGQLGKRRRETGDAGDVGDAFETDPVHGSKHWTEDEKSKLFNWLMGPGQDDHWNALRATKNSCLRECSNEVFGGKKTYQALKGCYERNFNLFKQIYAFEVYSSQLGNGPVNYSAEGERLREYERRLQLARKGGCDVGNLNARTVDHWHKAGWYNLFYSRWNGDPATTRPSTRPNGTTGSTLGGGDEADEDDAPPDFPEAVAPPMSAPSLPSRSIVTPFPVFHQGTVSGAGPSLELPIPEIGSPPKSSQRVPNTSTAVEPSGDQPAINVVMPQTMMTGFLQLLQMQSQHSKMKLEYLRRREEREEKESATRREADRVRLEREATEKERNSQFENMKHRTKMATDLLSQPEVDASVRQAAGDYLKKLFSAID